MDAIAPTLERLRHAESYDRPERSRDVNRVAYRLHDPFEAMWLRGDITDPQRNAARKLGRHYMGAMGVQVGDGDGASDLEGEESAIYHGQMVAQAAKALLPVEFRALIRIIEGSHDIEALGRDWMRARNAPQARAYGKALTILALERLALHWRFKEREP